MGVDICEQSRDGCKLWLLLMVLLKVLSGMLRASSDSVSLSVILLPAAQKAMSPADLRPGEEEVFSGSDVKQFLAALPVGSGCAGHQAPHGRTGRAGGAAARRLISPGRL